MKRLRCLVSAALIAMLLACSVSVAVCEDKKQQNGPYTVLEGRVTFAKARSLVLDGQPYPVSMFVRVFQEDEKGPESTMQMVANIGKIDRARLYILGGKVEKIVILKNL